MKIKRGSIRVKEHQSEPVAPYSFLAPFRNIQAALVHKRYARERFIYELADFYGRRFTREAGVILFRLAITG